MFAFLRNKLENDLTPVVNTLQKQKKFYQNPTMALMFRPTFKKQSNQKKSVAGNYMIDSHKNIQGLREKVLSLYDKFFGDDWEQERAIMPLLEVPRRQGRKQPAEPAPKRVAIQLSDSDSED